MTSTAAPVQNNASASVDVWWSIEYTCPHCQTLLRVPEQYVGTSGKCNHCSGQITIAAPVTQSGAPCVPEGALDESWYAQKREHLDYCIRNYEEARRRFDRPERSQPWQRFVSAIRECRDPQEERELCLKAIAMDCEWPFPYERLAIRCAKEKDYEFAFQICSKYFHTDHWQIPTWAGSTSDLLDLTEKLDRKLHG